MDGMSLLVFLFVGLIAGWLAGKVVQGGGFGVIGNIIVGVIGAFLRVGFCRVLAFRLAAAWLPQSSMPLSALPYF